MICRGAGIVGGRQPLCSEAGVFSLQTSRFPQHRLGLPPQDPAFLLAQRVFWLRALERGFPRRVFWLRALAHCFPGVFFWLRAFARGFPDVFFCFARVRIAFPVCFLASRVCARLPRRVFWLRALARGFPGVFFLLRACARGFPGVFFGFARVREAFPARFFASRVCARLSRRVFGLRALAHGFPRVGCAHSGRKIAGLVPASCRIELPVAVKSAILPV